MIAVRSLLAFLLLAFSDVHASPAEDNLADASSSIEHALKSARAARVPVLILFGADWCEGCRELDIALKKSSCAQRLTKEFRVVNVDVGNFDRNGLIDLAYGKPTRFGLPVAVVVSPDNKVLYTAGAGELTNAARTGDHGLYDFFRRVSRTK